MGPRGEQQAQRSDNGLGPYAHRFDLPADFAFLLSLQCRMSRRVFQEFPEMLPAGKAIGRRAMLSLSRISGDGSTMRLDGAVHSLQQFSGGTLGCRCEMRQHALGDLDSQGGRSFRVAHDLSFLPHAAG
jgi:hypothetical protein